MTALVPFAVLLPLLGAAVALALPGRRKAQQLVTLVTLGLMLLLGLTFMWIVDSHGTLVMQVGGWSAPVGISLVVDRMSALLLTVTATVLMGVLLFSLGQGLADGHEETPVSIFYPTYLVLGAGVSDAFIAGDLFNLYVGFEILLVASYVLITLGGSGQRVRAGVTYVVVSLVSSVLFLAAIGFVYAATGTVNIAHLSVRLAQLPESTQLLLNLALLIAFGIKAAVFPLAFWLPDSYPTAPAPVTAVFAGLLTKVGVYAIFRTQTVLFPHSQLGGLLLVVAALTLLVGILGAISQLDVKRVLSFTLVSHIGYLVFGVALGTAAGAGATVFYIAHHIIVQTTLFLAVGLVERESGTTSLASLRGMLTRAPVVAVLFFIPMLNLGGIPPFSGFLGKLALFHAGVDEGSPAAIWLVGVGALVSLLTLYALVRVWVFAFWRPESPKPALGTEALAISGREMRLMSHLQQAPGVAAPVRESRSTPRLMLLATGGMVAVTVALTALAGPLYSYAERAGITVLHPTRMIERVLDGTADPLPGGSGDTKLQGGSGAHGSEGASGSAQTHPRTSSEGGEAHD